MSVSSPNYYAAQQYRFLGYCVVPLWGVVRAPDGSWNCECRAGVDCNRPGKHPRTRNGHKDASNDPLQVSRWWERNPYANIGVVSRHVVVIDIDVNERFNGFEHFDRLCGQLGPIAATPHVTTGSLGRHIYLANSGPTDGWPSELAPGVELKRNCYFIAPPSRHRTGRLYEWNSPGLPMAPIPSPWLAHIQAQAKIPYRVEGPIPHAPASHGGEWALIPLPSVAKSTRSGARVLSEETLKISKTGEGNRNNKLNAGSIKIGRLLSSRVTWADAWSELVAAGLACGLPVDEVTKTVVSGLRYGYSFPRYPNEGLGRSCDD